MAREEQQGNVQHVFASDLPPYPEMIMRAIEELNEKNGSNKTSISKYIESMYGNLHSLSSLLTSHLNRMKSSGQLVFLKNNYMKPDPNSPPRRGRGRPPKPKTPLPPGTVLPPSRPRGRPPKSRDSSDAAATPKPKPPSAASLSGKKRGRPPKSFDAHVAAQPSPPAPPSAGVVPRGRGRPPKEKPAVAATEGA